MCPCVWEGHHIISMVVDCLVGGREWEPTVLPRLPNTQNLGVIILFHPELDRRRSSSSSTTRQGENRQRRFALMASLHMQSLLAAVAPPSAPFDIFEKKLFSLFGFSRVGSTRQWTLTSHHTNCGYKLSGGRSKAYPFDRWNFYISPVHIFSLISFYETVLNPTDLSVQ
jgi:hypothetical protein